MKNIIRSFSTNRNLYNNNYGNNHDDGTQYFYLTSLMIFSISDLSKQSQNDVESLYSLEASWQLFQASPSPPSFTGKRNSPRGDFWETQKKNPQISP